MSGSFRVVVADAIELEALDAFRGDSRFELSRHDALKGDALARELRGADALIVRSATKVTRDAIAAADRLRVIGRAGVGVDTIDVDAATEKGIAVLNAPAGNTISAAELAFALLLALVRRIPAADRSMRAGEWERKRFAGTELHGKTLGLIGAGRIGGEVARRARAFGMTVLAHDPFLSPDRAEALRVELASLDDVLARSDCISVHVPLTEATAGMIGERQLAAMRPGALLVNASRGGVIDEGALARAIESGHLGGAALDVFETEPLPPDHPLRRLDRVVLTPHLGASTVEAQRNVSAEIAEAVRKALLDGDLSTAVNAPAVGGEAMRRLRPLLALAERLGTLSVALMDGAVRSVEVRYAGSADDALRPLATVALIGVLKPAVGRTGVNFVNALHLAESRGIRVERVRVPAGADYAEYVEIRASNGERPVRVAGALLGEEHPRIVRIDEFQVDVVPRGALVVLRNRDVPGVIGRVGTLLGNAGINIAEYHQARTAPGEQALAAISIDGRAGAEVCDALRRLPEVTDVREVAFD